jgi:hypothetical protein
VKSGGVKRSDIATLRGDMEKAAPAVFVILKTQQADDRGRNPFATRHHSA